MQASSMPEDIEMLFNNKLCFLQDYGFQLPEAILWGVETKMHFSNDAKMQNFAQLRQFFWQSSRNFVHSSDISILCENQQTITIFQIIFAKIIYIFHFRENHRCFTYFCESLPTVFCPANIFFWSKSSFETNSPFCLASLNAFHTLWDSRIYLYLLFPFFLYSIALWYSPFNQGVANIQNPQHFGLQASNFFIGKDE